MWKKGRSFILVLFATILVIGCSKHEEENIKMEFSREDIAIDETTFPDTVFREYIEWKIDLNNDMSLSADEIENVKKNSY